MKLKIDKAIAIKPDVVRFNVEVSNDSGDLIGEYQISEDMSEYVKLTVNLDDPQNIQTSMEVDLAGIQQLLTNRVAEMQYTAFLSNQLTGHSWVAIEAEEVSIDETEESSPVSE